MHIFISSEQKNLSISNFAVVTHSWASPAGDNLFPLWLGHMWTCTPLPTQEQPLGLFPVTHIWILPFTTRSDRSLVWENTHMKPFKAELKSWKDSTLVTILLAMIPSPPLAPCVYTVCFSIFPQVLPELSTNRVKSEFWKSLKEVCGNYKVRRWSILFLTWIWL